MKTPLIILMSGLVAILSYALGLVMIFPMIASPDSSNNGGMGDFFGFWLGIIPKENYKINGIVEHVTIHGFALLVAITAFKSTKTKLHSKCNSNKNEV